MESIDLGHYRERLVDALEEKKSALERYRAARAERDAQRQAAAQSYQAHRLMIEERDRVVAEIDERVRRSRSRHKDVIAEKTEAEHVCKMLWEDYREADRLHERAWSEFQEARNRGGKG